MNSFEMLRENKKAVATIYENLFRIVKKAANDLNIEVKLKEPIVDTNSKQITNIGLLRANTTKSAGVYALGYSDPSFLKIWHEISPSKTLDPAAEPVLNAPKSLEYELMKSFFMALDPEFKAQGIIVDPKSVMIQEGTSLGGWSQITTDSSIKLPIGTPRGDLVFEIPIFNLEFAQSLTLNTYGFKDTARILVVDDSLVSRKHSRSCLAMAGFFNVDDAADGQIAATKVMGSTPPFELVVADWHMPNMTGFEMLKKLRGIPELKKLPIILVTGEKNKEEVISAIKEGASGYLVKPVNPDNFMKALKKAGGRV